MIRTLGFPNVMALSILAIFFGIMVLGVWIWALIDCLSSKLRSKEKILWLIIILFFNLLGAILFLLLGRNYQDDIDDAKSLDTYKTKTNKSQLRRELTRDLANRMIEGVCSGIAKYFDFDVTLVRLLWVLMTFMTSGFGLLFYIIAAIIIPPERVSRNVESKRSKKVSQKKDKSRWVIVLLILLFVGIPLLIGLGSLVSFLTFSVSDSSANFTISVRESNVFENIGHDSVWQTQDSIKYLIDIASKEIIRNYNYEEYNGHNLLFLSNSVPNRNECTAFSGDPFGVKIYERDCMRVRFRFDVDTDRLPSNVVGYYVDALMIGGSIKEISFTERIS